MPTRMIRDGWLESPAIDQLDPHAERFFLRLCLRADDFGRYHALPQLLKSNLYPLKDEVKSTEIAKWLAACAAAGLLRCYNDDGKPFLEILKFGQRMRQAVSKFPAPSDNCQTDDRPMPVICPSSDGQLAGRGRPESEGEGEGEGEGEEKGRGSAEGESAAAAPPAPRKKVSNLPDAEWLATLKSNPAYEGINIGLEYGKMQAWCGANRKEPTRRRFINWLNRAERPMPRQVVISAGNGAQVGIEGPAGWRDRLKSKYPENTFAGAWNTLPESMQREVAL